MSVRVDGMTTQLRTSRQGLELIKSFEGFRPTAVRLPDGRWTIGHGHVRSAREGVTISAKDAEDLLRFDLRTVEQAIIDGVLTPLNQNQFDALASLVFNISPGQFRDSSLLRRLNSGDHLAAAAEFEDWRKARISGQVIVVDALVRRRAIEKALFLTPAGTPVSASTPLVTPVHSAPVRGGEPVRSSDEGGGQDFGATVANAVESLARRQATPDAHAVEPPPAPPEAAAPAPVAEAAEHISRRIAAILEREEKALPEEGTQPLAAPAPTIPAPSPSRGEPARPPRPVAVDDTEQLAPETLDELMALMNEAPEPDLARNRSRADVEAGSAPWIIVAVLTVVAAAAIWSLQAGGGGALTPWSPALLASFAVLAMISGYFIWRRSTDRVD